MVIEYEVTVLPFLAHCQHIFEQCNRYHDSFIHKKPVDGEVADAVATALKEWAIGRGVTHFCHWFQPLTGTLMRERQSE